MKHKCLIIDDDTGIRGVASRVAISLKHGHAEAASMESARKRLNEVTYILLDMEIPETDVRGIPRIQNGLNLLEELVHSPQTAHIPIIVMTAHGKSDPTLAVEVLTAGAANWINKPFPATGRTLDKVIKETLAKRDPNSVRVDTKKSGRSFSGGELVLLPNRVTLLGHKIAGGDSIMRSVLEELSARDARGNFVALTTEDMANKLRCDGGLGSITGAISEFRRKVAKILLEREGIHCGEEDVIETVDGYRIREWITLVRNENAKERPPIERPLSSESTSSSRRQWILEQVRKGTQLRINDILSTFKCSKRTALRDTDALKQAGRIDYLGDPKDGYYVFKK